MYNFGKLGIPEQLNFIFLLASVNVIRLLLLDDISLKHSR